MTTNDLISRADAVKAIESRQTEQWIDADVDYNNGLESALAEIKSLPSAEAEWIPCSERLPSDDEYVIVSVLDDHGDTPWKYTTVAWQCGGVWISDNDILCGTAIAWMPLPMPYREESEVEE